MIIETIISSQLMAFSMLDTRSASEPQKYWHSDSEPAHYPMCPASFSENKTIHLPAADDLVSRGFESGAPILELPANEQGQYELLKPIPVSYERYLGRFEVTAKFDNADISMTGGDEADARKELLNAVLDIFDSLPEHENDALGNLSRLHHQVLNRHLRKRF